MSSVPIVTGYEKVVKGGITIVETKPLMEQIREEASRRVVAKEGYRGVEAFWEAMLRESIVVWLEFFPRICQEMIQVNGEKWKLLKEIGTKGKFTGSEGWSPNGQFQFQYEYTPEFYFFMKNYVYKEFFDDDNKKILRAFMKKILRGDSPMEVLMQVKAVYGSNHQQEAVVMGGENGSDA